MKYNGPRQRFELDTMDQILLRQTSDVNDWPVTNANRLFELILDCRDASLEDDPLSNAHAYELDDWPSSQSNYSREIVEDEYFLAANMLVPFIVYQIPEDAERFLMEYGPEDLLD